jgi:hypothetical protein
MQDFNLDNPLDAFRFLHSTKNDVNPVNILGAMHGLRSIMTNYNLTSYEISNLESKTQPKHFTDEEQIIFEQVQSLIPQTSKINLKCSQILNYASSKDLRLKCQLKLDNLNPFKVEILSEKAPKVILVHDYYSKSDRFNWLRTFQHSSTKVFHMSELYKSDIKQDSKMSSHQNNEVIEEFKYILSFAREGKIGYIDTEDLNTTVKAADEKLENLFKSIFKKNINIKCSTCSESYQFGTYGIGGFIDTHSDCYGTADVPMEDILDLKSGKIISTSE